MCDNINHGTNDTKEDYLSCSVTEVLQIKEAMYGRIDGASECNISNGMIPCQRNDCNIYQSFNLMFTVQPISLTYLVHIDKI